MDSQPLKFDAFHQLALQPHNDNLTAAGRDPVVWDAGGVTAQAAACHHAESAVFVAAQTLMIHRNTHYPNWDPKYAWGSECPCKDTWEVVPKRTATTVLRRRALSIGSALIHRRICCINPLCYESVNLDPLKVSFAIWMATPFTCITGPPWGPNPFLSWGLHF